MTKKKKKDYKGPLYAPHPDLKMDTQGTGSKEFHPEWQFYKIAPDPSQFDALPRVSYGIDDPLPRPS